MRAYSKGVMDLTSAEAIANARAVVTSDYFSPYTWRPAESKIRSSIITIDAIGDCGDHATVGSLSGTVDSLLRTIGDQGELYDFHLLLAPPLRRVRQLGLRDAEEVVLPLEFFAYQSKMHDDSFSFIVSNLGLDEEYHRRFPDAARKLGRWYAELTRNLNGLLPYKDDHRFKDVRGLGAR
ncbi:hypothetical protein JXA12_04530 [Candidatus Woesearchaeota archaeon]|nr:hypothetical protein [Candidatus Woesearchaeota archaeon]